MADSNKFSMAQLVISILTTSLLVGGSMYSISSKLIMSDVKDALIEQSTDTRDSIDIKLRTLESRLDSKVAYTRSSLYKLIDVVHEIEKDVIKLKQQQTVDSEINSLVLEVGNQLQNIRTDIAMLNAHTKSIESIAKKVDKLNAQVISLNAKLKTNK